MFHKLHTQQKSTLYMLTLSPLGVFYNSQECVLWEIK